MNRYTLVFAIAILAAVCLNNPLFGKTPAPEQAHAFSATVPVSFIENKGQVTDQYGKVRHDIDMKLPAEKGLNIFVGNGQIHYQWNNVKVKIQKSKAKNGNAEGLTPHPIIEPNTIESYRMDVELVGANTNAILVKEQEQPYYETYYTPTTGEEGATVHSYSRIVYKDVYPHIDWVLYSRDNKLKYDFVVHPGGNVADIQLRYKGATRLQLEEGRLNAVTPMGGITEAAPESYDALTHAPIASRYVLKNGILSFALAANSENGIIIDPELKWATYYGGTGYEYNYGLTADAAGNAYICGGTSSSSNIATTGVFQASYSGLGDGYLAKFTVSGTLAWATYYGGADNEQLLTVTLDGAGGIYAGGFTKSTGMATAGAFQATYTGYQGGLLVKFNSSGARTWATYYAPNVSNGGASIDKIACYGSNTVYLLGDCDGNATGLATTGAFQTTVGDVFLAKFTGSGARVWGTYFGNNPITGPITLPWSLATDVNGNIYFGGYTELQTGIATSGAYMTTPNDSYLEKFDGNGQRIWGTYYGGNGTDWIRTVVTDPAGNVYAGGTTSATNGIATTGAYQASLAGMVDGFIVKFNPAGTRQWGTYYGGAGADNILGLYVSPVGNIYYSGSTSSTSGIATSNGSQPAFGGGTADVFWGVFSIYGQRLWATYFGGPGKEPFGTYGETCKMAASQNGKVYLASATTSTSGIATPGSYQSTYAGYDDAFLVQYAADTAVYIDDVLNNTQLCTGDTLRVIYGVTNPYNPGNVFTLQLSNSSGSFASPTNLATKTTQFGDTFKVVIPGFIPPGTGYRLRIVTSTPADTTIDYGIDIHVSYYPAKPVATASGPACTGQPLSFGATCTTSGVSWSWEGPDNFTSTQQNPAISSPTLNSSGDYIVSADNGGCVAKDTVTVTVGQTPATPVAANNSPICSGLTLNLQANCTTPGVSYSWTGPVTVPQVQNPNITNVPMSANGDFTVTATLGNCNSSAITTAIINQSPTAGMYVSPNDTICDGTVATFVAVPANAGTAPQYQWLKNNNPVSGQTGLIWATAALVTGDVVTFRVTGNTSCNQPVTSQPITMTVLPVITTPSVTITSVPVNPLPGNPVTFTAHVTNGGPNPQYQWQRNGTDQAGAIYATWSANNLYPYDKITVTITSNDPCAHVKTATSEAVVVNFPASVKDARGGSTLFNLYPNPNDGNFTLKAKVTDNSPVLLQLFNAIGQVVYTESVQPVNGMITHPVSVQLPAGPYLLKAGGETMRVVVQ